MVDSLRASILRGGTFTGLLDTDDPTGDEGSFDCT